MKQENGPVKRLICACCGSYCRGRQWWNRDKGYGICSSCIKWLQDRKTPAKEMKDCYGIEDVHYFVESIISKPGVM